MKTVSVIGAGTMGAGIAQVFSQIGYHVHLIDYKQENIDRALQKINANLSKLTTKKVYTEEQKEAMLKCIQPSLIYNDLLAKSSLIIECISEDIEKKKKLFKDINSHLSQDVIVATNTSSIPISGLASLLDHPERFIGMHFMNPVPVMKLVEVIRGKDTSEKTIATIVAIVEELNKAAVLVNDSPGFVANRLLFALINEAVYILQEKVASAEDIDRIMKLGMSHPMGPLQLADYIGLDVCLSILEIMYENLHQEKFKPCALLTKLVESGKLGMKNGNGFYQWNGMQIVAANY